MISNEQLKEIVPAISPNNLIIYTSLLNSLTNKYEINTKQRLCAFIAQVAHESGSFRYVRELASGQAYEGRKDLGNVNPGDGVKFKGRGLIQITGRNNYKACSLYLYNDERLLDNPFILEEPINAAGSACWYWNSRNLNNICDQDDNWIHNWNGKVYSKFEWITVKINGGLNGYEDRMNFYLKAKEILT